MLCATTHHLKKNKNLDSYQVKFLRGIFSPNFELSERISIAEIGDKCAKDFESSRNSDEAFSNEAGPTCTKLSTLLSRETKISIWDLGVNE